MKLGLLTVLAVTFVLLAIATNGADGFIGILVRLFIRTAKTVVKIVTKVRIPKPRVPAVRLPPVRVPTGTITKILNFADLTLQLGNVMSGGCMYQSEICQLKPEIEQLQKDVNSKIGELDRLDKTNYQLYSQMEQILKKNQELAKKTDQFQYLVSTIVEKIGTPQQLDELGKDYAAETQNQIDIFRQVVKQYEDSIQLRLVITGITKLAERALYKGGKMAYKYAKSKGWVKKATDFKTAIKKIPVSTGIKLPRPSGINIGKQYIDKVKTFMGGTSFKNFKAKLGKGSMVVTSVVSLGLTVAVDAVMAKKMRDNLRQTRDEIRNKLNEINNHIIEESIANTQMNDAFYESRQQFKNMADAVDDNYYRDINLNEINDWTTQNLVAHIQLVIDAYDDALGRLQEFQLQAETLMEIKLGVQMKDSIARIKATIKGKSLGVLSDDQILMVIAREYPKMTSYDKKDLNKYRNGSMTRRGRRAAPVPSGYDMRLGDCPGNDIASYSGTDMNTCAQRCNSISNCVSFMMSNGNACYIKSKTCPITEKHNPANVFFDKRYIGCFIDKASRDLDHRQWADKSINSATRCIERCRLSGYRFAGTQSSQECYCDNHYGSFGRRSLSECGKRCPTNSGEKCGDSWRNSIYHVSDLLPSYRWSATRTDGLLRWVSVGPAGVWGVNAGRNIYYRKDSYGGNRVGKHWIWTGKGSTGGIVQISVGKDIVWGVGADRRIWYQRVSASRPYTGSWINIAGNLNRISVNPVNNEVWGVNHENKVFRRVGNSPIGSSWKQIAGISAKEITVDNAGVWAISTREEIYYRTNTYGSHNRPEGSGWQKVDGALRQISSGDTMVWGINRYGQVHVRAGMTSTNPTGTHWIEIRELRGTRQVSISGHSGDAWAVNGKDEIDYFKKT